MDEFAWSDLLQAMLLAARWTVALSVAAFAGGGQIGVASGRFVNQHQGVFIMHAHAMK